MAKQSFSANPAMRRIFNDLELYSEFCTDYGYKFDETTLGDMRSYVFQQFSKYMSGKRFKDQWLEDARKFGLLIENPAPAVADY